MGEVLQLSPKTYRKALRELSEHVMELTALAQSQERLAAEARQASLRAQAICQRLAVRDDWPKAA